MFQFLNQIKSSKEGKSVGFSITNIGKSYEGNPLQMVSFGLDSTSSSSGSTSGSKKKTKKKKKQKKKKQKKKKQKEKKQKKKKEQKKKQKKKKQKKKKEQKKSKKKKSKKVKEEKELLTGRKASKKKPLIWLDCQFHAREWIATPTCLYLIMQVLIN